MTSLLASLRRGRRHTISSLDDYAAAMSTFYYNGNAYGLTDNSTMLYSQLAHEQIPNSLEGYVRGGFANSGVVFAVASVRALVFSGIRFQFQRLRNGRPGDLFGSSALNILERPWPGGTTQDLLLKMELDGTFAGNSYWARDGDELIRLRPDWVQIICEPRETRGGRVGHRKIGYAYWEGGIYSGREPVLFPANEVAHYAPIPDPLANYRGMSWLTPVLDWVTADKHMNQHRERFFRNAATPQLAISVDKAITMEQFAAFMAKFNDSHQGVENAYKTMYLGGGADVKVIGADFAQMDFKRVQGHGETLISAAAGVPAVIVGLSEGIEAATYSNYSQARRRFADATLHPLWMNAAGSLADVVGRPARQDAPGTASRLWYDHKENPFLLEDRTAAAEIEGRKAGTIRQLIDAGFVPESVVAAVQSEDMNLLRHSGLYSVQLQPPGTVSKFNQPVEAAPAPASSTAKEAS